MCGIERTFGTTGEQGIIKWYGHWAHGDNGRHKLVKKVYQSEEEGVRARGRPSKSCIDGSDFKECERRTREREMWHDVVWGMTQPR